MEAATAAALCNSVDTASVPYINPDCSLEENFATPQKKNLGFTNRKQLSCSQEGMQESAKDIHASYTLLIKTKHHNRVPDAKEHSLSSTWAS